MKNITKILITILSLILLFAIGCGDRPTGSTPSNIPVATGENVTSLTGPYAFTGAGTETTDGTTIHVKIDTITGTVTKDNAESMINYASKDIMIQNNTINGFFLENAQLKKTADANTVEAGDGKSRVIDEEIGMTIIDYIKITFDDINDPQTAEIEYHIKLDSAEGNFDAVAKSVAPYTRVQNTAGGGGGN